MAHENSRLIGHENHLLNQHVLVESLAELLQYSSLSHAEGFFQLFYLDLV